MDKRYMVQFQNSVTKAWVNVYFGNFDDMEVKYNAKISAPECERYRQKWRMIEFSIIHSN